MTGFNKRIHALINVAHKNHGSIGIDLIPAPGKRTGCHKILHDLYAVFIFKTDAGDLIKCHSIPYTHKTYFPAAHIVKKVCHSCLTAGHQYGIWTDFFVNMTFTRSPGAKLTKVVIIFSKGNQPGQKMPFDTLLKKSRFKSR